MNELSVPASEPDLVEAGEVRAIAPVHAAPLPVAQVARVAVASFVAGAASLAVVRRRAVRRAARRRGRGLAVLGSRSFLVDIHLLDG